jgi:hypothetical protein
MTIDPPSPFVATGSYPTRDGNLVRPLIDGEPAFRRICEAIEAARHSVWATITFMWPKFSNAWRKRHRARDARSRCETRR